MSKLTSRPKIVSKGVKLPPSVAAASEKNKKLSTYRPKRSYNPTLEFIKGMAILLAVIVPIGLFTNSLAPEEPVKQRFGRGMAIDREMDPNKTENKTPEIWSNPEISWIDKLFCIGGQASQRCSYEPLHPWVKVFDHYGKELKFNDPTEEQRIAETIEYENNAYRAP